MAYVNLADVMFPVGTIWLSMSDISPATFIGGTWTKFEDEKFLLPSASVKETGGEAEVTLTEPQMPKHKHGYYGGSAIWDDEDDTNDKFWGNKGGIAMAPSTTWGRRFYASDPDDINTITSMGENKPHNNMPPYRTCFMWERVA